MIPDSELARVEALAKAATPGHWIDASGPDGTHLRTYTHPVIADYPACTITGMTYAEAYANKVFGSAANPAFVLGLIAEVRRLRALLDEAERMIRSESIEDSAGLLAPIAAERGQGGRVSMYTYCRKCNARVHDDDLDDHICGDPALVAQIYDLRAENGRLQAEVRELRGLLDDMFARWTDMRDAVLHSRGSMAESVEDSCQVNAVLGTIDDYHPSDIMTAYNSLARIERVK